MCPTMTPMVEASIFSAEEFIMTRRCIASAIESGAMASSWAKSVFTSSACTRSARVRAAARLRSDSGSCSRAKAMQAASMLAADWSQ